MVAAFAFAAYMLRQARKPTKWVGRLFVRTMNVGHSRLTDWGLSHLKIQDDSVILDVGCGGGKTAEKLASIAVKGVVYGIDYAEGGVAASRARNKDLVQVGRVVIEKAPVSHLPFEDCKFDLVTAIETQYYWPDLAGDMREILRVLKPGGTLIIIAETYRDGKHDKLKWPAMWLLRSSHLSAQEQQELFLTAGYTGVSIFEDSDKGWICATGRKRPASDDLGGGPVV